MAISEFPENLNALTSLALALFELQKYPEALNFYMRAALLSPSDPIPLQKVAEIQERLGDLANATKTYMDVAELFARNRDVEKAIRCWSHVVALNPGSMTAHTRLALVYERLGRTPLAIIEFISIASLLQSQGSIQKAIQTIKHALEVDPNNKEATLALAILETGKLFTRPSRPHGGTGPLMMSQVVQSDSAKSGEPDRPRLRPYSRCQTKSVDFARRVTFRTGRGTRDPAGPSGIFPHCKRNEQL